MDPSEKSEVLRKIECYLTLINALCALYILAKTLLKHYANLIF